MRIITEKGKGEVKLTDEQMSAIMSALAVATAHWDGLADPEVSINRATLIGVSHYLLTAYGKSVGISAEEVKEAIDKAAEDYKK